jgi:predicted nucleic acid-binding protein
MKHLVDVNVLLAAIWASHPAHAKAATWLEGKRLCLCPIAGLGFLRISTQPKAFNFTMDSARYGLTRFCAERGVEWIADDLLPLDSHPSKSDQVTDTYLADLAAKHSLRLGTLDAGIKHPAADLVA